MNTPSSINVIGGGLAGCEAAWQIARRGLAVTVHEMRPHVNTDAHVTHCLAELVCSNSFRSDDAQYNAVGLLHEEMRRAGSLILRAADLNRVAAGSALAVDRVGFSKSIEAAIEAEPLITVNREEIYSPIQNNWASVIIATGPLTSPNLAAAIQKITGEDGLAFFDAISPIIYRDSIDFSKAWFQSRYDKNTEQGKSGDYINFPLNHSEYQALIVEILKAEKTVFKDWEGNTPYFEGCLPIEIMAERGAETLRYGPMKPVGLKDPRTNESPYAVVQARQDNAAGTLYNIVGFQTKLRYEEQKRVFRMIPGLERVKFARLGGIHRNTFINSPRLLDSELRLRALPRIRFAGQITGVEGYVESAASGYLAGYFLSADFRGEYAASPPPTTALGALLDHITNSANPETFQPMNINFGLFPPLKLKTTKRGRKPEISKRALMHLETWLNTKNIKL